MPTKRKSQTVDLIQLLNQVESLEKGSDELRKLRNVIWKKIAEPELPAEAVEKVRAMRENIGEEIFHRIVSRLKKESRQQQKAEVG